MIANVYPKNCEEKFFFTNSIFYAALPVDQYIKLILLYKKLFWLEKFTKFTSVQNFFQNVYFFIEHETLVSSGKYNKFFGLKSLFCF